MSKKNITSENIIKLKKVRLSFPHIWSPQAFEEGKPPQFQATFLLDPANADHAKMIKEIKRDYLDLCKKARFGDPKDEVSRCFGLANNHRKKKKYDGYEDMYFISTANKTRPTIVNRDRSPLVESDGKPYAGCYVNTNITLWTSHHPTGGPRVSANLRIIQFVDDGDAFGNAAPSADDELDVIDVDDSDADDDWDGDDDL